MSQQKYKIVTSDAKFAAYFSLKDNVVVPEKTDESCVKVYRIRALRDIRDSNVDAGEFGGWVESEYNLSQTDACWIQPDAVAVGRARVSMNAKLYSGSVARDFAQVTGYSEVWLGSVVSERAVVMDYARIKNKTLVSGNGIVGDHADLDGADVRGGFVGGYTFSRLPGCLYVLPAKGESPVVAVESDSPYPFCSPTVISSGIVKSPFDVVSTSLSKKELFTYNRTNGQVVQLIFSEDGCWELVSVNDKPICERSLYGDELLEQYAGEVGERVVYGKGDDLKYEIVETDTSSSARPRSYLRVRALRSIPERGVDAGTIGGFVNSYSCLSQTGSCWVGDSASVKDSKVTENALVCDDAYVHKNSVVSGNAKLGDRCEVVRSVVKGDIVIDGNATLIRSLADGKVTVKGSVRCEDCKIYGGGTLRSKMAGDSTVWTHEDVLVCVLGDKVTSYKAVDIDDPLQRVKALVDVQRFVSESLVEKYKVFVSTFSVEPHYKQNKRAELTEKVRLNIEAGKDTTACLLVDDVEGLSVDSATLTFVGTNPDGYVLFDANDKTNTFVIFHKER